MANKVSSWTYWSTVLSHSVRNDLILQQELLAAEEHQQGQAADEWSNGTHLGAKRNRFLQLLFSKDQDVNAVELDKRNQIIVVVAFFIRHTVEV